MQRPELMVTAAAAAFLIAAACERGVSPGTQEPAEYDVISLHWPAEQPGPDLRMCVVAATGEQIGLDPEPVIGVADFERAYLASANDTFVTVRLTDTGRAALVRATTGRMGQRIAIVVDDQVVALPVINRPLDIPELQLMPQKSRPDAEALADMINRAIANGESNSQ